VTRRDEFVAAVRAGRGAEVGDRNPFVGKGILADLWRGGYNAMLAQRIESGPARQRELAVEPETPRP
jgi:hypothetical protein